MTEFERSLAKVLVHEGGYSNHPKDPGGATMKGVTQRVYDEYRKSIAKSIQTVKLISPVEIQAIYRRRYWDLIKGDELPAGVGYVVFDGAVNSGVGRSPKWLQRALADAGLYGGKIDGLIGPGTLNAVAAHPDHDKLIARIYEIRLAFLKALKTWPTFGKGWKSRVDGVKATGQAWASGSVAPPIFFVDGGQAKALETDALAAPPKALGDSVMGGGTAGGVVTQAISQLSPLANTPTIANVVMLLTVASVLIAVGGWAYSVYAKRKADKIAEAMS